MPPPLAGHDYMIGALSDVDFMLGHACYMARVGCVPDDMTHLHAYVKRLEARPALRRASRLDQSAACNTI